MNIPLKFRDPICPVCGGKIQNYDVFSRKVYSIDYKVIVFSQCEKCNTEFLLDWDVEEKNHFYREKTKVISEFEQAYLKDPEE